MTLSASPRPAAEEDIRSARFRREREPGWARLEALVARAEARGVKGLSYSEVQELTSLYRLAMSSLSVVRVISMDRALMDYLDAICARAYLVIYAPQESLRGLLGRLFLRGIPQAVRRSALPLAIGFLAMMLGALMGFWLYQQDVTWFYSFVPSGLADGRTPDASASYLRDTLFDTGGRGEHDFLAFFATYLFSHNTQVAILTFAMGIFLLLPSFLLTFYNGLVIGAFFAMFHAAGLGVELFGWLSIHGVTELSAFCIACAGGAQLGLAVVLPGQVSRREALRTRGRDAVKLMILAALMLVAAGLIEGVFRQLVQSTTLRLVIGWGIGVCWLAWLGLCGRRPENAQEQAA